MKKKKNSSCGESHMLEWFRAHIPHFDNLDNYFINITYLYEAHLFFYYI